MIQHRFSVMFWGRVEDEEQEANQRNKIDKLNTDAAADEDDVNTNHQCKPPSSLFTKKKK